MTLRPILAPLFLLSLLLPHSSLQAGACLPDLGDGNICSASDFVLEETKILGPTSCAEGTIIPTLTVRVGMQPTANERYDIGFFVGDQGASPVNGESCTFVSLSPLESSGNFDGLSGHGPYRDLDGNQCGDTLKSDGLVYSESTLTNLLCQDSDGDGQIDIPYAMTWQQQKGSCDDPLDPANFYPPSASKCIAGITNIEVEVTPPPVIPSIGITKTPSPPVLLAPGGEVTYSLSVTNDGTVAVTLTSLVDQVGSQFSDLNGAGDCSLPQALEPGESYRCSFSVVLSGDATTAPHVNTVRAGAVDGTGTPADDSDSATVHFIDPSLPSGSVGDLVWNDLNGDGLHTSNEPGLVGVGVNLFRKNNSIFSLIAQTTTSSSGYYAFLSLPAGTYRVTLDTNVAPLSQMVHTAGLLPHDVTLEQYQHYVIADFGFARASIAVTKTADPTEVQAPVATVDYTVSVINDGPIPVILTYLYDDPFGDLNGAGDCSLPQSLAPGEVYTCSFAEIITGVAYDQHINSVTALAVDQEQNPVYAGDSARVFFIAPERGVIGHLVWNDLNGDGIHDPGEPGIDNVTLHIDHGFDVMTRYGGQYFFHNLPARTYTVSVTDDNGILQGYSLTTANEPYTTTITGTTIDTQANFGYARPEIQIIKSADRIIVPEWGHTVTYTVTVINSGPVDLTVTSLIDNPFGDLTARGCNPPSPFTAGSEYSCSFEETLTGTAGDVHNNVVTVTATDVAGATAVSASDSENVRIIGDIGGAIGYLVWLDSNGNGVRDTGEPGIDGVTVDLLQSGSVIATDITEQGGKYFFLVPNGSYEVRVSDVAHILDGYILSSGTNPHGGIAILNSIDLGVNFGYTPGSIPPSLTVEKTTNGEDADLPTGPVILAGQEVVWSYTVSNTGPYFLTDVMVTDDQGVTVSCPGDALDIGASMTCGASGVAVAGQYANIGTSSSTVARYGTITDSDPSHYWGKSFPFIPPPPCATFPLHCYVVADRDSQNSEADRLLKYTFRENSLEMVNELGVTTVESMTFSLDGETLYATNGGVLGTIDTTPGLSNSFTPINPAGVGIGDGSYGTVVMSDIDGLAFDPTKGTLYGTERYKEDKSYILDLLIQIDPASGTIVKNAFGAGKDYVIIATRSAGVKDADDIDIDASGQMYGVAGISGGGGGDQGLLIDKATGAVTAYAALHDENGNPVQDMEGFAIFNHKHYYGTTGIEFAAQQTDNTLYKIDRKTGETQEVIRLDQAFDGFTPVDFEAISCFPVCGNK